MRWRKTQCASTQELHVCVNGSRSRLQTELAMMKCMPGTLNWKESKFCKYNVQNKTSYTRAIFLILIRWFWIRHYFVTTMWFSIFWTWFWWPWPAAVSCVIKRTGCSSDVRLRFELNFILHVTLALALHVSQKPVRLACTTNRPFR